jgi:hypothetical protein
MHSVDHPPPTRQRGPHNDPSMLDGDSGHGNPGDVAGDEWAVDTDTDVVDAAPADELEEVIDGHTPDAEAEAVEEDAEGVVTTIADDDNEDEDEDEDEEADADTEDDPEGVDEDAAADAEIDGEGDARGPEPDETTLEVELNRMAHREPAEVAKPPRAARGAVVGTPPTDDYLSLTVPQVLERAVGMSAAQLAAVLDFEQANKNRKTLVARLTRLAGG